MNILHITEIVDIGIEKEKKRRDFYGQVAAHFPQPDLKALFGRLRDWEEEHIRKFSEIKSKVDQQPPAESYPGELSLYMRSLVDDRLYQDIAPESFSKKVASPQEAIRMGIAFEKDAVLFFSELKKYCAETDQQVIEQLINEEKQHIVYLSELRAKI